LNAAGFFSDGPQQNLARLIHFGTLATLMPTLQQQIADKFLAALAKDNDFDAAKIESLRRLLSDAKKPKPDDFVAIFSVPAGEGVA
jgi:hypothetical protein